MLLPLFGPRIWILLLASTALVGCGRPTAQISGTVLWNDGSPLTGEIRVIRFEPSSDTSAEVRKAAFADIESDGAFQMLTRQPGDGVFKGKYKVTFTVYKTAMGRESAIPERYTAASTSPFDIEVTKDIRDLRYEIERE